MTARRLLVLGGTGEGLAIACQLGVDDIYSIAGLGVTPTSLRCRVRVGGFGGAHGLTRFALAHRITTIIDATHPYAARISANALVAARATGIPCWTLRRPPWRREPGDDWREVADWAGIVAAIAPFGRPLFTLGRAPLAHLDTIPAHQHWVVRCLDPAAALAQADDSAARAGTDGKAAASRPAALPARRATLVAARGPFTLDDERAFFTDVRVDVVVSKLSGGAATQAKLDVARERGLPVVMLARPRAEDNAPAPDEMPAQGPSFTSGTASTSSRASDLASDLMSDLMSDLTPDLPSDRMSDRMSDLPPARMSDLPSARGPFLPVPLAPERVFASVDEIRRALADLSRNSI